MQVHWQMLNQNTSELGENPLNPLSPFQQANHGGPTEGIAMLPTSQMPLAHNGHAVIESLVVGLLSILIT